MYKERIAAIMKANREEPDILDFVEERVNSFVEYVNYTSFMETRVLRMRIEGVEGEQWRTAVEDMDHRKRDKHEVVLAAATQLNRLATSANLPPFYDGPIDHEHRTQVGDMCLAVVTEYFENRNTKQLNVSDLLAEDAGGKLASALETMERGSSQLAE